MDDRTDEIEAVDPVSPSGPAADPAPPIGMGPEGTGEVTASHDAPDAGSGQDEVDMARIQIEQTRAEMSETIDAIQEKLTPAQLTSAATETVKRATIGRVTQVARQVGNTAAGASRKAGSTAGGAGMATVQQVKSRPLPVAAAATGVALTGLGITALQWQRRRQEAQRRREQEQAANTALARAWRAVGQVSGPAAGAATWIAGRAQTRAVQGEVDATGQLPLNWWTSPFETPLTTIDLLLGLTVGAAVVLLRRGRRSA